jgi:2-oxoglutarate ferredoxin oxidoreductase subunit beta
MMGGAARIVPTDSVAPEEIMVHDVHAPNPSAAFALSRLSHGPYGPTPVGIFRDAVRSSYEQDVKQQLIDAQEKKGPGDLSKLIRSLGTWKVE